MPISSEGVYFAVENLTNVPLAIQMDEIASIVDRGNVARLVAQEGPENDDHITQFASMEYPDSGSVFAGIFLDIGV